MPSNAEGLPQHILLALATIDTLEVRRLIQELEPQLKARVRHLTKDQDLAAELLQFGRLGIVIAAARFDPTCDATLKTYAVICGFGSMRDRLRSERLQQAHFTRPLFGESDEYTPADIWDQIVLRSSDSDRFTCLIDAANADSEMINAVQHFVASLSPELRATVEDIYWNGLTEAEAARKHGLSRTAVGKRVKRIQHLGRLWRDLRRYNDAA